MAESHAIHAFLKHICCGQAEQVRSVNTAQVGSRSCTCFLRCALRVYESGSSHHTCKDNGRHFNGNTANFTISAALHTVESLSGKWSSESITPYLRVLLRFLVRRPQILPYVDSCIRRLRSQRFPDLGLRSPWLSGRLRFAWDLCTHSGNRKSQLTQTCTVHQVVIHEDIWMVYKYKTSACFTTTGLDQWNKLYHTHQEQHQNKLHYTCQ